MAEEPASGLVCLAEEVCRPAKPAGYVVEEPSASLVAGLGLVSAAALTLVVAILVVWLGGRLVGKG